MFTYTSSLFYHIKDLVMFSKMVSIPDWSRFRRGPPPPSPQLARQILTPRERYIRAMEKQAITEASKKGYFLDPNKDDIVEEFGRCTWALVETCSFSQHPLKYLSCSYILVYLHIGKTTLEILEQLQCWASITFWFHELSASMFRKALYNSTYPL